MESGYEVTVVGAVAPGCKNVPLLLWRHIGEARSAWANKQRVAQAANKQRVAQDANKQRVAPDH
eukprot:5583381-Prymnesium_polylepis.1